MELFSVLVENCYSWKWFAFVPEISNLCHFSDASDTPLVITTLELFAAFSLNNVESTLLILISKSDHFPTKPHKKAVCVFPILAFVMGQKSSTSSWDGIKSTILLYKKVVCVLPAITLLFVMEHTHTKQRSVCFNYFYHAPQESCLFCAHCHIPPGDFETAARQDGPVFGLTSQSSTGGSHRLDRGGCLPDRWSSGFRNYGASEELWMLSTTICWYLFHICPFLTTMQQVQW